MADAPYHHFEELTPNFSRKFINAFCPLYIFLQCVGQLPFEIYRQDTNQYAFRYRKFGIRTLLFAITFIIYVSTFLFFTFGLISDFFGIVLFQKNPAFLEVQPSFRQYEPKRNATWEEVIMENHKGEIYTTYAILFTAVFGTFHILFHGDLHIHYLNYWNKVVELIKIDPTSGIRTFHMTQLLICLIQLIFDIGFFYFFNGIRAVAGIYVVYLLRVFVDEVPNQPWFFKAQAVVMLFLIYGHLATRALIIQFMFFCALLKNVSREWNRRLRRCLTTYLQRASSEMKKHREDFKSLLRDQLTIVQLFKMTDVNFGLVLLTFYGAQLCCIMIQMIHFWKLAGYVPIVSVNNSSEAPPPTIAPDEIAVFKSKNEFSEGVLIVCICLLTVAIFSMAAKSAHFANEEILRGFQIVRRHGLLACQTKGERNFLYTLIVSYARNNPVTLSVDGYSILNKTITLAMLGTIAGLIIHFIQYEVEKYFISNEIYRHQFPSPFY